VHRGKLTSKAARAPVSDCFSLQSSFASLSGLSTTFRRNQNPLICPSHPPRVHIRLIKSTITATSHPRVPSVSSSTPQLQHAQRFVCDCLDELHIPHCSIVAGGAPSARVLRPKQSMSCSISIITIVLSPPSVLQNTEACRDPGAHSILSTSSSLSSSSREPAEADRSVRPSPSSSRTKLVSDSFKALCNR
jgi:hypothetical protein